MSSGPGVPQLLRELNDRAVFDIVFAQGSATRNEVAQATGLSKVTGAQALQRLEARGLVAVVGEKGGARGPNARVWGVVPSAAYVGGLEVGPYGVTAAITDLYGEVLAKETVDPDGGEDPVGTVHNGLERACRRVGIEPDRLGTVVVGTPGVIDPGTGDMKFAFDLPAWQAGLRDALTRDLSCPVLIENDVNLVAVAEHDQGAASEAGDFALMWASRGVGMALVIGDQLHRGRSGCAGEIGYLPVPGVPLASDVRRIPGRLPSVSGGLQTLVGEQAVSELAEQHELTGATPAEWVTAALDSGDEKFIDELSRRFALGVASVCVILDPGLVVLAGSVATAGGRALVERVEDAVARISLVRPDIRLGTVVDHPVLRGALVTGVAQVREALFA